LADLQQTVTHIVGHQLAEGRAQDRVSSPAKDRRSANCATQPTNDVLLITGTVYCWHNMWHYFAFDIPFIFLVYVS